MAQASLTVAAGDAALCVRSFSVHEQVSTPFHIDVVAVSENPSLDMASIVGGNASLTLDSGYAYTRQGRRRWSGLCSAMEQARALSDEGLSTYHLQIVTRLWLLT
jgi:type VI secretion system secreted protein VgrG